MLEGCADRHAARTPRGLPACDAFAQHRIPTPAVTVHARRRRQPDMRGFSSLLVLLVGCAHPISVAPVAPACPSCPSCPPVQSTSGSQDLTPVVPAPKPEEPTPPVDPRELARVLASLFPKHLKAIRDCPKPKTQPKTWVEVDDLELENLDAGRFVPVVERRERGHYTDSSDQIRYVIRIDNCQQNTGGPLRVEALFSEWALTPGSPADWRRPRPIMLRERREAVP